VGRPRSGDDVGVDLVLDPRNTVLEQQLLLLEPLKGKAIRVRQFDGLGNPGVQRPVFLPQLDKLPLQQVILVRNGHAALDPEVIFGRLYTISVNCGMPFAIPQAEVGVADWLLRMIVCGRPVDCTDLPAQLCTGSYPDEDAMLTKIALTLVVIAAVWLIFFRRRGRKGAADGNKRLPHPLHLARCPGCGIYRLQDAPCNCTRGDKTD
jgi:cbb3-type cytochrome oxidase subunit 3